MRFGHTPRRPLLKAAALGVTVPLGVGRTGAAREQSRYEETVVISEEVHHLGDGDYGGEINSRFRESPEGRRFRTTFRLSRPQAGAGRARIVFLVRGVQQRNTVRLNRRKFVLDESPDDGTDAVFAQQFDPGHLSPGENRFEVEATEDSGGDVDDLEISDVRLQLGDLPEPFAFAKRSEKMTTAGILHDNSVLSEIKSATGVDVEGDPEMATATLDALERAVNEGTISRRTAQDAFQRHLLAEEVTSDVLARIGPGETVVTALTPEERTNLARVTARFTIQTAVDALLIVAALKAAAVAGVGATAGVIASAKASASTAVLTDAVGHFLSELMPPGDNVDLQGDVQRACRTEANSIFEDIQAGVLSTGDAIANAVEPVVDGLVDAYAGVYRGWVELGLVNAVVNSAAPAMGAVDGAATYASLRHLDRRLQPDRLATDGLRGDNATASAVVDDVLPVLHDSIKGVATDMEELGSFGNEFNVYDTIVDLYANDSDSTVEVLLSLASQLAQGLAGLALKGVSTVTGVLSFIVIKRTHEQLIRTIEQGRRVRFTHV